MIYVKGYGNKEKLHTYKETVIFAKNGKIEKESFYSMYKPSKIKEYMGRTIFQNPELSITEFKDLGVINKYEAAKIGYDLPDAKISRHTLNVVDKINHEYWFYKQYRGNNKTMGYFLENVLWGNDEERKLVDNVENLAALAKELGSNEIEKLLKENECEEQRREDDVGEER